MLVGHCPNILKLGIALSQLAIACSHFWLLGFAPLKCWLGSALVFQLVVYVAMQWTPCKHCVLGLVNYWMLSSLSKTGLGLAWQLQKLLFSRKKYLFFLQLYFGKYKMSETIFRVRIQKLKIVLRWSKIRKHNLGENLQKWEKV